MTKIEEAAELELIPRCANCMDEPDWVDEGFLCPRCRTYWDHSPPYKGYLQSPQEMMDMWGIEVPYKDHEFVGGGSRACTATVIRDGETDECGLKWQDHQR
jgi:hypothetical protein